MPDSYIEPTFHVHAQNIHTGENQWYGPFTGLPTLTYDLLRASCRDNEAPEELFGFDTAWYPNVHGSNSPDYASWIDQDGDIRYDGWRHLTRHTRDNAKTSHNHPDKHYWTDLVIVVNRDA